MFPGFNKKSEKYLSKFMSEYKNPLASQNKENKQKSKNIKIVEEVKYVDPDVYTLEDLIKECPKTNIIREFFKEQIKNIKSKEDVMFEE